MRQAICTSPRAAATAFRKTGSLTPAGRIADAEALVGDLSDDDDPEDDDDSLEGPLICGGTTLPRRGLRKPATQDHAGVGIGVSV